MRIIEPKNLGSDVLFASVEVGGVFQDKDGTLFLKFLGKDHNAVSLSGKSVAWYGGANKITPRPDLVLTTLDNLKEGK